jgi:hypothetical protein
MAEIAVSFFSEPNAESRTRRVSFPHVAESQLHCDIRSAMQGTEFFACYMPPKVVSLRLTARGLLSTSDCFLPQSDVTPWPLLGRGVVSFHDSGGPDASGHDRRKTRMKKPARSRRSHRL